MGFPTWLSSGIKGAHVPELSGVVRLAAEGSSRAHVGAGLTSVVPQTEHLVAHVDL